MVKLVIAAVGLALIGATPLFAQSTQDRMPAQGATPETQAVGCRAAMLNAEPRVNAMTDNGRKQEIMGEMNQARAKLALNDEIGCQAHLQNVQRMMPAEPIGRPGQ